MALKTYKPNTPGLRQRIVLVRSEITADKPEKSLTKNLHKKAGRDTFGRVSVRRRGGGHKRAYRIIDFSRDKYGVPGVVKTIEYDPNRSVRDLQLEQQLFQDQVHHLRSETLFH